MGTFVSEVYHGQFDYVYGSVIGCQYQTSPNRWNYSPTFKTEMTQTYEELFEIYRKNDMSGNFCDLIPPYCILFELYDKPWIHHENISNAVQCAWKQIGVQEVALIIIEYLFVPTPAYTFKDFIHKQIANETEDVQAEYEAFDDPIHLFSGRNMRNMRKLFGCI
eukprot:151958_1